MHTGGQAITYSERCNERGTQEQIYTKKTDSTDGIDSMRPI